MLDAARIVAPALLPRAIVLWMAGRLLVAVLPLAAGQPFGSIPPPPPAMVLLCGLVGLVDVRVRRERALWGNLGAGTVLVYAVYALAAIPGEVLLGLAGI